MCRNSFPSRNTAVAQFLFVLISSFIALVYSLVLNSCWCLGLIRYPLDWMFELHLIHIHSWHPVGIFRDETAGRLASDLDLNANRLKLGRLFHESLSDPSDHPWSRELEVKSLEIHVMSELSLCRHSSCQQNSRRRFHLSQLRLWESLWMVLYKAKSAAEQAWALWLHSVICCVEQHVWALLSNAEGCSSPLTEDQVMLHGTIKCAQSFTHECWVIWDQCFQYLPQAT